MTKYGAVVNTQTTPQTSAVFGREKDMSKNSAGGYTFTLDKWDYLRRFLILGSESNSYYASARSLTQENAQNLLSCIADNGPHTVAIIREISLQGVAPKNDPAIFALSLCAKKGDDLTRGQAFNALPDVCRTGTHLFQFLTDLQGFGGWGRSTKRAVGNWYRRDPQGVVFQVTKYANREGWSHRDVLRLAKPVPRNEAERVLFRYIAKGELPVLDSDEVQAATQPWKIYAHAVAELAACTNAKEAAKLIHDRELPREVVPTELLTHAEVWEALLPHMPLGALVRNLATMTRVGLIAPLSAGTHLAVTKMTNSELIAKSRLHPIALLSALCQYSAGRGFRSSKTWEPVSQIGEALNTAFYLAFKNVESTGKRWVLGIDVSGSMDGGSVGGVQGLTPRMAAGAMALVTARTEPQYTIRAFSHRLVDCPISPRHSLDDVVSIMQNIPMGSTDCALPITWATDASVPVDAFVIYTDNETWSGNIHPFQALEKYKQKMGIDAKLIVAGFTATEFTIADPRNPNMCDIVGFDSSAPAVMADFVRGTL